MRHKRTFPSAINARVGVGYTRLLRNGSLFTVNGGYLATVFINSFAGYETNENIIGLQLGALSTGSVRSTLSNFSANGFFVNFGLKW